MLWKTAKTRRLFLFRKTIRSNISFTLIIELFWGFKIARFEFKVTMVTVGLHYGLWAKCTQLWPLNLEPRLIRLESKNPFAHNYATQIMWLTAHHISFLLKGVLDCTSYPKTPKLACLCSISKLSTSLWKNNTAYVSYNKLSKELKNAINIKVGQAVL